MKILDKYKNNTTFLTNEEFLATQIIQLKHVFFDELSAIKNTMLEYIAFSKPFADTFLLDESFLGQQNFLQNKRKINDEIKLQEQQVLENKKLIDSVYQFKQDLETKLYVMRKRPLINPSTDDCVGIIIFAIKMDLTSQRKLMAKHILGLSPDKYVISSTNLTEKQQQVINCLLLGFHKRKEIAAILGKVTHKQYNEGQIKTVLEGLYEKFSCSSFSELITLIVLNSKQSTPLSGINIPDKVYNIKRE